MAAAPTTRRAELVGVALVAGAAASWGLWSLVLRPTGLPGAVTGPIVFAGMGLWLLPSAVRAPAARWDRATIALLLANAGFDALNVATFFEAMRRTTIAVAVLTHYLAPVLIALAAPRVDGIRVPRAALWAAIATAGLVLVLAPWDARGPIAVGAGLGAISAVAYAGNVFVVRRLAPRLGVARTVSYHSLIAAALLLPLGAADLGLVRGVDLLRLAIGAATLGALSGVGFVRGLDRIGAARAAVLTFAEPIVAVAIGWIAWGEALGWTAAVGAALIVAAGLGVSRATPSA